jgi:hypothetical protein
MSSVELVLPAVAQARAALNITHRAFLRGQMPVGSDGKISLPDECYVLDVIGAPVTPDFDSEYATIRLQVGAWSRSIATGQSMQVSARAALATLGWRLIFVGPVLTDGPFSGVLVDYELPV